MASSTSKRHRMRCGVEKCRKRWTLDRHPDSYARSPECPACGNVTKVRHVEEERRREMAKKKESGMFCRCYGLPFPHTKAGILGCNYHPKSDPKYEWTEEDIRDLQAIMETPRSG